ncbi:hypothetical protein [Halospeciosus flavus]|uniref:Uncharacterized protein n=1 Tax=Halospeciosus flavus TaxID=3032283 RepID=A0ABD5Z631_9EURY|nr:hypothetical protein [Halospeciosus flavus]
MHPDVLSDGRIGTEYRRRPATVTRTPSGRSTPTCTRTRTRTPTVDGSGGESRV